MPLSEHEQRLLEQMERALYAEDPKFASALDGAGLRTRSRRTVILAVAGFVTGAALVVGGMVPSKPMAWLAALGVLLMAGSVVLAVVAWRQMPRLGVVDPRTGMPVRRRRSVVDRMEQRWQRRQDQQRGGV
ncbi:DUF3040 domain-containing protein [Streptacidiphilus monticola]|uniref:DUF3040 domain-containing protein n=1 Tax=Streptacidiphilus monticola TaxID=2161674 RepID=A0ABW1G456_9ACTN